MFNRYVFGKAIRITKSAAAFLWVHAGTDEVFLVLSGNTEIEFRDGLVRLDAGQIFGVPKGLEHRSVQPLNVMLLIKPRGVINYR
jgi:mannose-6-phosphate isomerase-like protein (cupin superfamily)